MNVDKYRAASNKLIRNPDDPEALVNQFANLSERMENGKHYLPFAKRAYEVAPQEITALFNYSSALHRTGNFEQALKLLLKNLPLVDDTWRPTFLHHIGIAYRALNENTKAVEYYEKAHALKPDPDIMKDRAMAILAQGRLKDGLEAFEIRRETAAKRLRENKGKLVAQQKLPAGVVHWEGQDLTGKTVVVYHEEGQGDFIMVCRFIPLLRKLGAARIHLCGPAPDLLDLVTDNIKIDQIVPLEGPFECNYVIGSMSLPWRCGVDTDQVSGKAYFNNVKPAGIPRRGQINVGLVWRGNPDYGMDVHRSMAFAEYCPLFDLPGVAFHSLQMGAPAAEVSLLGYDGFVANLEPLTNSWRETACLIQSMDIVVSVDTAVAHLAGALGKPVAILITNASDWRWNRNSQKTIWYDSMKVIRQKKQDDWAPCIKAVREILQDMSNERRSAA